MRHSRHMPLAAASTANSVPATNQRDLLVDGVEWRAGWIRPDIESMLVLTVDLIGSDLFPARVLPVLRPVERDRSTAASPPLKYRFGF